MTHSCDRHHPSVAEFCIYCLRARADALTALYEAVKAWRQRPTRDGLDEVEKAFDKIEVTP